MAEQLAGIEVIKRSIVPAGCEHAVTEWLASEARGAQPDLWTSRSIEAHEFQADEAEPAVKRVRTRQHASGVYAIIYVAPYRAAAQPELPLAQHQPRATPTPPPRGEMKSVKERTEIAKRGCRTRRFNAMEAEREWQEERE